MSTSPWPTLDLEGPEVSGGPSLATTATQVPRLPVSVDVLAPGVTASANVGTLQHDGAPVPLFSNLHVNLYPLLTPGAVTTRDILTHGLTPYLADLDIANAQELSFGIHTCQTSVWPGPRTVSGGGQVLNNPLRQFVVTAETFASYDSTPNSINLVIMDSDNYSDPAEYAAAAPRLIEEQSMTTSTVIVWFVAGILLSLIVYLVAHVVVDAKESGGMWEPNTYHYVTQHRLAQEHALYHTPGPTVPGTLK